MDITATLEGIVILSIEERIRIVQVILESISPDQSVPDLTIAQKQELDQCSKAYDVNPDDVMTQEEVWKSIRGK